MCSKPVTMSDVARRARVSESTVSRVLSGSETAVSISEETRQRVLAVVEDLNYQPNPFARALRGKGANLLGLIVREIDDPFFAQLIEVIGNEAKNEGFDLVLGYAKSDPEEAIALSELLDLRRSDGLFLLGDLKESPEDYTFLARMGKDHRMVSLCRGKGQLVGNTASVGVDNHKGVFLALEYLTCLGHERIAFVTADRLGDLRERTDTYREFAAGRWGDALEDRIFSHENSYRGGYDAAARALSQPRPPTAILAVDDTMALGALAAAFDLGVAVPNDLSIMGFDDVRVGAYVRPALTTIRQPIEKIGRRAVELLIELIRDGSGQRPLHLFEPELIVRDSCGPPRL